MIWAVGALSTSVVSSPSLEHLTGYPARPSIVTPTDRPHSGHHSATSSHQTVCRSPERPLCLAVFHPELQWCVPASSQYMVPSRIPESVHRHCGFGRYGGRFRPPVVPVLLVRPLGKHQHRHKRTLADCHCCRIVWEADLSNKRIVLNCDNQAVVVILNKQTSKNNYIMHLVRRFVCAQLSHNFVFRARNPELCHWCSLTLSERTSLPPATRLLPWGIAHPSTSPSVELTARALLEKSITPSALWTFHRLGRSTANLCGRFTAYTYRWIVQLYGRFTAQDDELPLFLWTIFIALKLFFLYSCYFLIKSPTVTGVLNILIIGVYTKLGHELAIV